MILFIHRYSDFQTPLFLLSGGSPAATMILVIQRYSDFQTPPFLQSGGSQQLPGF